MEEVFSVREFFFYLQNIFCKKKRKTHTKQLCCSCKTIGLLSSDWPFVKRHTLIDILHFVSTELKVVSTGRMTENQGV